MMSNDAKPAQGCAGWMKWLAGSVIGLIAACGSVVTILEYISPEEPVYVPAAISATAIPLAIVPSPNPLAVSPELWQEVTDFLSLAVVSEVTAYEYGDASHATVFYGDALETLQKEVTDLNSRGIFLAAYFDYDNSFIANIRLTEDNKIEVDSCEYWAKEYYDRATSTLLGSDPSTLIPQTIVIERLNASLYITGIAFYTGQAFCS